MTSMPRPDIAQASSRGPGTTTAGCGGPSSRPDTRRCASRKRTGSPWPERSPGVAASATCTKAPRRTTWAGPPTPRTRSSGGASLKHGALLEATKIAVPEGAAAIDVRQIAYDSRKTKEAALFVAIPGFHRDGHVFAKDAVARGAVAVVAEHAIDVAVPVAIVPDGR